MPRPRHQQGWVEVVRKQLKKCRGHYYVYLRREDGSEQRCHKTVTLGPKARLRKWEAQQILRQLIPGQGPAFPQAGPQQGLTFGWFWHKRYLLGRPRQSGPTRDSTRSVMNRHALPCFGEVPLTEVSPSAVQAHLKDLAQRYNPSVVEKANSCIKAVLREAVRQGLLAEDPSRQVDLSLVSATYQHRLSPEEVKQLLGAAHRRDRLVLRLLVVCGLRPAELFALHWKFIQPGWILIEETVYRNRLRPANAEASQRSVVLPESLEAGLVEWKSSRRAGSEDFVFEGRVRGRPMDSRSYSQRWLKPLSRRLGIAGLSYQALRRTHANLLRQFTAGQSGQTQLGQSKAADTASLSAPQSMDPARTALEAIDRQLCGPLRAAKGDELAKIPDGCEPL